MRLAQLENGYRYNSDTLVLYAFIKDRLNAWFKGEVLDVGCGCGVLGLLLKRDFDGVSLSLLDVQDINLEISRQNARANGLEAKILNADFAGFKSETKFDLIVSNPPFYHDGVKQSAVEHLKLSRYASALSLRGFIAGVNVNLKPKGELFFCYDTAEVAEIFAALKEFRLAPVSLRFVHAKAQKAANLVLVHAKKGSRSKAKILPPLVMMDENGYTKEATEIFAKAATKSEIYKKASA
ncbi:tRNA1(Val) (adenine(37)-N6)-methyltransferase [Campylobacter curvus]|uniref:tRNA1(Val) (adenine(37)-N6)-methyltransferase n=1 Tax=Campylobacter curvus TaxID=200 RepID=UPI00037AC2BA|nr:methyltransferase [Campylobacter curvus]QKF61343.1 tRNA m6A37 methyltransferase [Campylobacter curvus]UEB49657.1 methyltransferase [Campylobacter curvus]